MDALPAGQRAIDPITLEVINQRLQSIADEMQTSLCRSAFSSLVKEAMDASFALFDRRGNTLAQAPDPAAPARAEAAGPRCAACSSRRSATWTRRSTIASRCPVGSATAGPAILDQGDTTTVVYPGQVARVHPSGSIVLTRAARA